MKTISIPTNDRLDLLSQTLESLRAAEGISSWVLVFTSEPNSDIDRLLDSIDWAPCYRSRNPCKMGCWENTFRAASYAMALGSELNLYLEDDIIVSADALTLAEQFARTAIPILALRRPEATLSQTPTLVKPFAGGLLGDGFAWRSALWPTLRSLWFALDAKGRFSMWDWSVEDGLKRLNLTQVRPCMNRSQNIGLVGTHQKSFDPNRHSPCYSGPPVSRFIFTA